jgi:hypothetical protein
MVKYKIYHHCKRYKNHIKYNIMDSGYKKTEI